MNRIQALLISVAMAATMSAQQTKTLHILHTNDTHSCVYPLSTHLADTMLAGRGGYLRRLEMIKQEREADPDLLLFDSGDFSQGSSYYTLFKGDVEVGLMNRMHYDAATIGNHEFDFGLDNMARLFRQAQFPIVCANYDFSGTEVEGLVKPYVVIKRKGVKIGVFGLSPAMDGLVAKENWKGVTFLDPRQTAQQMVTILREKEKCDVVVCLSHLGWDNDLNDHGDNWLLKGTTGIDLVLGGHSHTYMTEVENVMDAGGKMVAVDQNGKHAIFVGNLHLTLSKK